MGGDDLTTARCPVIISIMARQIASNSYQSFSIMDVIQLHSLNEDLPLKLWATSSLRMISRLDIPVGTFSKHEMSRYISLLQHPHCSRAIVTYQDE